MMIKIAKPRDSNIESPLEMFQIINLHYLECKYKSFYWHLMFVSGLVGQCYDTTVLSGLCPRIAWKAVQSNGGFEIGGVGVVVCIL